MYRLYVPVIYVQVVGASCAGCMYQLYRLQVPVL